MTEKSDFEKVGEVQIQVFQMLADGTKVYIPDYFEKNNLIVSTGRSVLMDLMLGETRKQLSFIRWGKGGAPAYPAGNPLEEFEVEDSDIDVKDLLLQKNLGPHERLTPTSVRFTETIISDEVDNLVNEAGIFFRDPQTGEESIFARITFPTVSLFIGKGFGIELAWTFNFNKTRHVKTPEEV